MIESHLAKLGLVEPLPYDAFGVAALNLVTVRDGRRQLGASSDVQIHSFSRAVVVAEVGTAAAVLICYCISPRRRYQLGPGTRYPLPAVVGR